MAKLSTGQITVELLYLEDLGEALEAGPNVRRVAALLVVNGELWPTQFLITRYCP